jgi:hypothetical protein
MFPICTAGRIVSKELDLVGSQASALPSFLVMTSIAKQAPA